MVFKPLSKEEKGKFDKSCQEFYEKYIKAKKGEIDMTQNLFDNAKFGDMFLTAENKQAVFLRFAKNSEQKFAILYVEGWGNVQVFRHNGKEVHGDVAYSIIKKQQEPVSEELEEAARRYVTPPCALGIKTFKAGANWQKEQMMKDAKSGIGNYDNYIKFEDGTWIDLDPSTQLKPAFNVNEGDKVKVIVIKEE